MKNTEQEILDYFRLVNNTLNTFNKESIAKFVDIMMDVYLDNGTIYIFGNGGSGSNASHFCGDFVKGASSSLTKRFKVVCLNDNTASHMAIANDMSYDDVFVEQLKNFLKPNDLVIGISGSGNSMNVIKAMEYAKGIGAKIVTFCGFDGGKTKQIADLSLHAEINNMEVAEDIHLILTHCVKTIVINRLAPYS